MDGSRRWAIFTDGYLEAAQRKNRARSHAVQPRRDPLHHR